MTGMNNSLIERTTGGTDLLLGAVALLIGVLLIRLRPSDRMRRACWVSAYLLLAAASMLGAVAHGLQLPRDVVLSIWHPLSLFLVLAVAFFVLGSAHELWGARISRRLLPWLCVAAVVAYLVGFACRSFLIFIVYEGAGMSASLCAYLFLCIRRRKSEACWMIAGICVSILAATLQRTNVTVTVTVGWTFDHNGVFHLIQTAGIILFYPGLRAMLRGTTASGDYSSRVGKGEGSTNAVYAASRF